MTPQPLDQAALDCVDALQLLIDRIQFIADVFGGVFAIQPRPAAFGATVGAIADDLDAARLAFRTETTRAEIHR